MARQSVYTSLIIDVSVDLERRPLQLMEVKLQAFVFSALDGGQWSASRSGYSKTGRYSCTKELLGATSRKVAGSIDEFILVLVTLSFRPHCGPWVDSVSSKNEYQGYLLDGKGGRCLGLTILPPLYADCPEI